MSSETLINTACNPTPLLPGSGLETKLQLHHNGVMTYSHYVNGSIFSVPKFEVVAKNNHNSTGFDVMGHPVKASDHLVETVYGLVKFFLGWDYLFNDLKINMNFYFLIRKTTLRFVSGYYTFIRCLEHIRSKRGPDNFLKFKNFSLFTQKIGWEIHFSS